MKTIPLPFRPLSLFVLLAACRAHGDSATWTGVAADNNWATVTNWSTTPAPFTPPATVPGTNAGETATFSGTGTAGLSVVPLVAPSAVKAFNFEGSSVHTFASEVTIENLGTITMAADTAAQTIKATFPGNGKITNNSANLLTIDNNPSIAPLFVPLFTGVAGTTLTFDGTGNTTVVRPMADAAVAGGVIKDGLGTTTFSAANTNVAGGFTMNGGTIVALNQNGFSNKTLNLNGGIVEMRTANSANSQFTGVAVSASTTLAVNSTGTGAIQWTFGATAATNTLTSTNSPVLTFLNLGTPVPPATNHFISMTLATSGFDGTWKIGNSTGGGLLFINSTNAAGGATVRVDLGQEAVTGIHMLGTSALLASGDNIVPVVIGELKGTHTGALLAGRRNVGTRTTGTRFEVGGLGTNTSFSGVIADGAHTNGLRQMNGNPDGTASALPDATTTYGRNNGTAGAQGTVEFVKTGSGTLSLPLLSSNTHSGGTVFKGGVLAVFSDAALGAAYDGTLRPFSLIPGATLYNVGFLPNAVIAGGNPTAAASVGLYTSQPGISNAVNSLFLSFSSQPTNDDGSVPIVNTATGSGYTSVPVISFTGGTPATEPATPPVATVRVKGLLTFDGGTLKTNAGITSNRATVLAAGGGTIDTNTFDSTLSGVVNGGGSLTKSGPGKLSLTGVNTHTGDTIVTAGILSVNGTSITDTAKLTINGGQVEVAANETVGTLVLGAAPQAAGTYGSTTSTATNKNNTYFTGSAVITVGGAATGYAAWASTNAGNQTANLDFDNDGVKNGTEYFMNSAIGFTANPGSVGGVITWINGGNIPSSAYGTQFVVQTSTNLVNWTPVAAGDPNLSNTAGSVTYTLTGTGSRFARLVVTPN